TATGVTGSATATVTVTQPHITSVTSSPVGLGEHSNGWYVTLDSPAPTGGLKVNLDSSNASQVRVAPDATTTPSGSTTITIPAGQTNSPSFVVSGVALTQDA